MPEIVSKNSAVDADAKAVRSRSRVPYSNHLAGTYRFGEYAPCFFMEAVNGDKIPLRSITDIRSYTMKSPLMSSISMKKDYFQVPMEAILPMNWDKLYTNPVLGDDVTPEDINCVIHINDVFINHFKSLQAYIRGIITQTSPYDLDEVTAFNTAVLKYFVYLERWFSSGSLLANTDSHLNSGFGIATTMGSFNDFDRYFDAMFSALVSSNALYMVTFSIGSDTFTLGPAVDYSNGISMSYRQFLEVIRDDNSWSFDGAQSVAMPAVFSVLNDYMPSAIDNPCAYLSSKDFYLNIDRPIAYQLICAHFYSNDKIDYIYSAELFRENVYSLLNSFSNDSLSYFTNSGFTYNGVETRYDYLSGFMLNKTFSVIASLTLDDIVFCDLLDFWRLILGYNRSLRFVDYFTGAKSRPLAVGDVNVNVVNSQVNVVDVTRNIQRQRFFNFVNKIGRRFEDYVESLGGFHVQKDFHSPFYLAHVSDLVNSYTVENTGASQISDSSSITSYIRGESQNYCFEIDVDRPSIIMGIQYFDIPRYYTQGIDKHNLHVSRFDMFNPFMQYIGDQNIERIELNLRDNVNTVFGYSLRHIEYKTRVNTAFGGFSNGSLPGWQFLADEGIDTGQITTIGPDYIRSRPSELDRFYVSLTGWSLGTYWHFICDHHNITEPSRPMSFTPSIL